MFGEQVRELRHHQVEAQGEQPHRDSVDHLAFGIDDPTGQGGVGFPPRHGHRFRGRELSLHGRGRVAAEVAVWELRGRRLCLGDL